MLPLGLLNVSQGHPVMVELKNGETFNGHLVNCDPYMNINLREVIRTSSDGSTFWRIPEIYIRGLTIKYLRVQEEMLDLVKEEQARPREDGGYRRGAGNGQSSGGYGNKDRGGRSDRGGSRGGRNDSGRGGYRADRGGDRDGFRGRGRGRGGMQQN